MFFVFCGHVFELYGRNKTHRTLTRARELLELSDLVAERVKVEFELRRAQRKLDKILHTLFGNACADIHDRRAVRARIEKAFKVYHREAINEFCRGETGAFQSRTGKWQGQQP